MKRAKIVLTAVALFAVIGGAVAFKASRTPQRLFKSNAVGICNVPTTLPLTTLTQFPGQTFTVLTSLSIASTTTTCPSTTWYTIE